MIKSALTLVAVTVGFTTQLSFAGFDYELDSLVHRGPYQPELDGTADELTHDAYVYQVQSMANVNWMYIGFAPRQDNPNRIKVVFSKQAKTMRVEMHLTKADLADYPNYLVRRAKEMNRLIEDRGIEVYQPIRLANFYTKVLEIELRYGIQPGYNNVTHEDGWELLKELFPTNIFMTRAFMTDDDPEAIAAVAHFVYPITINRRGTSWPPSQTYYIKNSYGTEENIPYTVQERRSYHRLRNSEGVVYGSNHIFSGWPAFWLHSGGAGTGVHGPIRFSRVHEPGNTKQIAPYGNGRDSKLRFWRENEFRRDPISVSDGLDAVSFRWDVVRRANSAGCFRAETLELRHLLPADPAVIFNDVAWVVQTPVDTIQTPEGEKYVDVNYYMVNPYDFPQARMDWIRAQIDIDAQEFLDNSYNFEYLDPATLEFTVNGSAQTSLMGELNRAGSDYQRQKMLKRLGKIRPRTRPVPDQAEPSEDEAAASEQLTDELRESNAEAGVDI
ncbi:MAG: hypothetical protein HRT45_18965 [Bdellovibrionales bacterium]|nr:hypothetical protein [Bdellovibrionales bacterium]